MDFEGERYVRLFTRDTPTWVAFKPESRAVLPGLLRKLDKRGRIEWSPKLGTRALAALLGLRQAWVDIALRDLAEHETISVGDGWLEMPNFVYAQNVRTKARSGAEHMADMRDRQRSLVSVDDVTKRDESDSQPSPAQPSQAKHLASLGRAGARKGEPKALDPRALPVLTRIDELRGERKLGSLSASQRIDRHIAARLDEGIELDDLLLGLELHLTASNGGGVGVLNATTPFTGPNPNGKAGGWSWTQRLLDEHRARAPRRPAIVEDHDLPQWARERDT